MIDRLFEIRTAPLCLAKHPHLRETQPLRSHYSNPIICELPTNHREPHRSRCDDGRVIVWSAHVTMESQGARERGRHDDR